MRQLYVTILRKEAKDLSQMNYQQRWEMTDLQNSFHLYIIDHDFRKSISRSISKLRFLFPSNCG
jgi:hypothetical protein